MNIKISYSNEIIISAKYVVKIQLYSKPRFITYDTIIGTYPSMGCAEIAVGMLNQRSSEE